MTDSDSEPLDRLDDLASATLDGEADPTAAAGALDGEARQALDDRVALFGRIRDQVADLPDPPGEEVRDRMIARAISMGTTGADAPAESAGEPAQGAGAVVAPVRSLERHRARRTMRLRRLAPVAVAAAVLLLGAVVVPSVLDGGDEDLASSFDDEGADMAETEGDAEDAAASPAPSSPAADALADADTEAMEEGLDSAEASAGQEGETALVVPDPTETDDENTVFSYEELTDGDLLDAVVRYRSSPDAPDEAFSTQALRSDCGDIVRHPIDLIVDGFYQSQTAVFVADVDGSAVLAVTVLSPSCRILAQVSSN